MRGGIQDSMALIVVFQRAVLPEEFVGPKSDKLLGAENYD